MRKLLVIKFELAPEVSEYLRVEGGDLSTALGALGLDISDGVDTRLMAVDEKELDGLGREDDDYVVVRGLDTLEFWGYELDEVLEDLDIDRNILNEMGVRTDKII